MPSVSEIINGISTVISTRTFDGALDDESNPVAIGLKREEDIEIRDMRVMDGFSVTFAGNHLKINYQSECTLKEVSDPKFENDLSQMLETISSYLKKEYRKQTKSTFSLTKKGDLKAIVQNLSRTRSWVQASQEYEIGGMDGVEPVGEPQEPERNKDVDNWLALDTNKKPKNDKRKKSDGEKE